MSSKARPSLEPGLVRPGMLNAIRIFTLVAMGISAYLAWVSLNGGTVVGCGPDSGCDKVLQSRWAYWFGKPVSLFAVGVYSLILGASYRLTKAAPPVVQRKAWACLVACAFVVVGAVLWFVGLQVFEVRAICPYCMAAHASGFLAALLLLVSAPMRSAPAKPWDLEKQVYVTPRTVRKVGVAVTVALVLLVFGQVAQKQKTFIVAPIPGGTNKPPTTGHAPVAIKNPPSTLVVSTKVGTPAPLKRMFPVYGGRFQLDVLDVPIIGAPTNEQVIVSLFDYTCHHCRAMHPTLVEAQRTFSNSLVILSLPMPLDPDCNPTMQRPHPMHTNACDYARLGLAVWRANRAKHHEFDDWLLTGEKPPPLPEARAHAAELVGAANLENAVRDPWVADQLKLDVAMYELAYQNKQGSMPQLILGDKAALGTYLLPDLVKLLAENLPLPLAPAQ